MAENESLDLDKSPRMRLVYQSVKRKEPHQDVAPKLQKALIGGLRKALNEFTKQGVPFSELLENRNDPQALSRLLRKLQKHELAQQFVNVASTGCPTEVDAVAGWVEAIVDKYKDQICHRTTGEAEAFATIEDATSFFEEVRADIAPVVERIVTKLVEDPNWKPKQAPKKGHNSTSATVELQGFSLLGAGKP